MGLLDTLFTECEGYLELRALGKRKKTEFFRLSDHDKMKQWISEHRDCDLYFGVATRDGKAGKKENVVHIPAVFIDIDFKTVPGEEAEATKVLDAFPLQPTIRVKSGGGIHCYWKLKEPCTLEDSDKLEIIMRGLATRLNGDMACAEVARILRIPNTKNYKYKPPRKVILQHCNGTEFSLLDFEDFIDCDLDAIPERATDDVYHMALERIMECSFMRYCRDSARELPEPLWRAMISVIMRESGGPDLIHSLSKGHPGYKPSLTDKKIIECLNAGGPYKCIKIKQLGYDCGQDCGVRSPAALAFINPDAEPPPETLEECPIEETMGDNDVQWGAMVPKGDSRGTIGGQFPKSGGQLGDSCGDKPTEQKTVGLAALVETYITNFVGRFSTKDITDYINSHFGIAKLPREHQKALAKILSRSVDNGRLERTVRGGYRIIDTTLEDLDEGIGDSEHRIKLPLRLNELVYVEPKEVIMVCGNFDAGKTCFALQVGLLNKTHTYNTIEQGAGGFGVYHFVSEMGGVSFRNKMNSIDSYEYADYRKKVRVLKFKAWSIADQIQPNSINIIDYLEPAGGDFREIVPTINAIFDNLNTGVAVICVQMRQENPVGGMGVFWRPRLAVGLANDKDRNCKVARILKGKNVRNDCGGIDGWQLDFWVRRKGTEFEIKSDGWQNPREAKRTTYVRI